MKKIIILITVIFGLTALSLNAIVPPRLILQQLVLEEGEITDLISNTGISHTDIYQIEAVLIVDNEVIAAVNSEDDDTPVRALRIVLSGAESDNPKVLAIFNQSAFPVMWPADSTLRINITYTENEETATRDITIPSGFGLISQIGNDYEMIVPPYSLDVNEETNIPIISHLKGNYPNPFNPDTIISFSLKAKEQVSIKVYDIRGRLVKTLIEEQLPAGEHIIVWDGTNNSGNLVASGIYFSKMITEDYRATKKMSLIK